MKTLRAGSTRWASASGTAAGASNNTLPWASLMRSISTGATGQPPLASTP